MLTIKDLPQAQKLDTRAMSAVHGGNRGYGYGCEMPKPYHPGSKGDTFTFDNSNNSGVLAAGFGNNAVGSITVNGNGSVSLS